MTIPSTNLLSKFTSGQHVLIVILSVFDSYTSCPSDKRMNWLFCNSQLYLLLALMSQPLAFANANGVTLFNPFSTTFNQAFAIKIIYSFLTTSLLFSSPHRESLYLPVILCGRIFSSAIFSTLTFLSLLVYFFLIFTKFGPFSNKL